ncbi:MAG: hypothetical protein JXR97_01805 [Planctomycetes bacterium]|nr:hypothetical protein [Planctomycetota bacterium]
MSSYHINSLKAILVSEAWEILDELPGNDYDISAFWKLKDPKHAVITLAFNGLTDHGVLPLEKAYGCYLFDNKSVSLYFARANRSWPERLEMFMKQLIMHAVYNVEEGKQ